VYLRNLLDGLPWYSRAEEVLSKYPMPVFIHSRGKSPREIPFFGIDVRRKFAAMEKQKEIGEGGGPMSEEDQDSLLALRIYRMMQSYVNFRTEEKSGKKFKDFKARKDSKNRVIYPDDYREARAKVCGDAFLAMRGRREQDFVEYFAGTICSVPQFMTEQDYISIAAALKEDWEKVKTLSMLAVSAHSYLAENTDDGGHENTEEREAQ